ncbi:hypothetical protein BRC95_00575 [Halobacteriales archaeon QS_5_68_33]|nr:MAG: hypothetical protein BRC95_00575 [Halobacteriales archaeon QS_5_68_33]
MYDGLDATRPRIRPHPDRDGLQALDPIQDAQFTLLTPDPVGVSPCDTDRFYFPVDAAVTVDTDAVAIPYVVDTWVRDSSGNTVTEIDSEGSLSLPPARYHVELSTTQMKLYLSVEGAVVAEVDEESLSFAFDCETVHVGARSYHEQPAATVTTTGDPADVMRAVSTLGSALKTTTCERSFPTLRGHPPLVERDDELSVPDSISTPDTEITIEVPPRLEHVYPVAPLAYYFGATVRPGPEPRLVTDDWAYPLDGEADCPFAPGSGFEASVARVLKQSFLLDCVTRTEGYYEVDLAERSLVAEQVDLDFAALYERSTAEQVRAYMGVPAEALTGAMPTWKLTADVRPKPDYVGTLPFLADELAVVRCPEAPGAGRTSDEVADRVQSIFRGGADATRGTATLTRSTRNETSSSSPTVADRVFRPAGADSIEQTYVGEGIPVGASKMTVDAFRRRLSYEPSNDPQIRVAVVNNDERMADENAVSNIYGTRDWIEFDISFDEALATDEMRTLLQSDIDFLHYIGHVDKEGIRCPDGYLDTKEVSDVGVNAFVLNACDSYDQGYALVDNGAMAGIATVTDVVNEAATSVGRTVARLLNQGFSLAATVEIIKQYEQIGYHYIVVGDSSTSIVTNESGTPNRAEIEEVGDDQYELELYGYPRLDMTLGTIFRPHIDDHSRHHLNAGKMCSVEVSRAELFEFLSKQNVPVVRGDELLWSYDLTADQ